MIVKVIAGGSGGNAIVVESGGDLILLDCGLAKTKIEKMLVDNGFNPTDIKAIFVTHSHKDHVQGIGLATKYGIPVYASEGTWKDQKHMPLVHEDLRNVIDPELSTVIFGMVVNSFKTYHNDYGCLGFTVTADDEMLSVLLDTGMVDDKMIEAMIGSNIIIIEANHDIDLLMNGDYHEELKARISSDLGHLSNSQTAEVLFQLVRGLGERILLTHLSGNNNTPELAIKAVEDALELRDLEKGIDYYLEVIKHA